MLSLVIFCALNIKRIVKENIKYGYNPFTNPYFYINVIGFSTDIKLRYIKDNLYLNNKNRYLILNKKLTTEEKNKNK